MKIHLCNIGLVILLTFAGIHTVHSGGLSGKTEAESQVEREPDSNEIFFSDRDSTSEETFFSADEDVLKFDNMQAVPSTSVIPEYINEGTTNDSSTLVIPEYADKPVMYDPSTSSSGGVVTYEPLIILCFATEELKHLCQPFCLKFSDRQANVFPISELYTCQENETEIHSRLILHDTKYVFYILHTPGFEKENFLYREKKNEHTWFYFTFKTRISNVTDIIKALETRQSSNSAIVKINILEDLYLQTKSWNNYAFNPALINVYETTRSAWLELRLTLAKAQHLLQTDLEVTVTHAKAASTSIDADNRYMIFGFYMTVGSAANRIIQFLIINVAKIGKYDDWFKKLISGSICKGTDWFFESKCIYCYEPIIENNKKIELFTKPKSTSTGYRRIVVYKKRITPKLKLIRDQFIIDEEEKYFNLCPPEGSMLNKRNDYHEYLSEELFENYRTHTCKYSGRLQEFELPSGTVTYGILISINKPERLNTGNGYFFKNYHRYKSSLQKLDIVLEENEEKYFLYGHEFYTDSNITFWYFELFKVYQNETRLHKHVISSESISQTDENIDFYSPYKCPYGYMTYERIYSEDNIEDLFEANIQNPKLRAAVISIVKENQYIIPVPLVSPLDIEYEGYESMSIGCSVFGLWGEIYEKYWSKVDRLTRKTAESYSENMVILTGVYETLMFKEKKQNFMLNEKDIEKYQTPIHHTIWRLFFISGKLMFFTTINNIFHSRDSENPFFPLKKPLCEGSCENQNLGHLNEANELPYTFCCPYNEVKENLDKVLDEKTKLEMHKLEKLVLGMRSQTGTNSDFTNRDRTNTEISLHPTSTYVTGTDFSDHSELNKAIEISCYTNLKNEEQCAKFCFQRSSLNLFPLMKDEVCEGDEIISKFEIDEHNLNHIYYAISKFETNLEFTYITHLQIEKIELRYIMQYMPEDIRNPIYPFENVFTNDSTININIMEQYFIQLQHTHYMTFSPSIIKMFVNAYVAWKEVEERTNLFSKRLKNKLNISYIIFGDYPDKVKPFIPQDVPVHTFIRKLVKHHNKEKKIEFFIINYPDEKYIELTDKPCNSICNSIEIYFSSKLIYCCADTDNENLYIPPMQYLLRMPPDPNIMYEPIVAYMIENKNQLWIKNSKDTNSAYPKFCAPERNDGNKEVFIMKEDEYYITNDNGDKVCKWPAYYNRVEVPNSQDLSYGIYFLWNYEAHEETQLIKSEITLANVKTYDTTNDFPNLPTGVWYSEIFRILKGKQALVYSYRSNGNLWKHAETRTGERNAYNPYACNIPTYSYEKLLGSDNVIRRIRRYFKNSKFIDYLREHNYLEPIPIVPPKEIGYTGWSSFASDECHNFIMWSEIYNTHWLRVEKLTADLWKSSSSKIKTIYTSSHGSLTFQNNGSNFSLHEDGDGDILRVPSAVWRLVTIKKKSIVFIVINNIFHYYDEYESPFKKEMPDIITKCDCKALGYEHLNPDEEKPFVFCCSAKNVLEHEMYIDIFEDKGIVANLSETPKKG